MLMDFLIKSFDNIRKYIFSRIYKNELTNIIILEHMPGDKPILSTKLRLYVIYI